MHIHTHTHIYIYIRSQVFLGYLYYRPIQAYLTKNTKNMSMVPHYNKFVNVQYPKPYKF